MRLNIVTASTILVFCIYILIPVNCVADIQGSSALVSSCKHIIGEWDNYDNSKYFGRVRNRNIFYKNGKYELIFNYIKNGETIKTEYYSGDWRCNNNILETGLIDSDKFSSNWKYKILFIDSSKLKIFDFTDKSKYTLRRVP